MRKLSVIVFSQGSHSNSKKKAFPSAIFKKFALLLKRNKNDNFIKEYQLYEDLTMNVIELPYNLEELAQKEGGRAARLISRLCEKNGLERCVLPGKMNNIKEICELEKPKLIMYKGEILFRALIEQILRKLAGRNKENFYNCEVVITEGNSKEELFAFVRCLLPLVKYLNIFTHSRKEIEDEVNNIYEESGLSIGIISDSSHAFKDADIIINLGDLTKMTSRPRIKKGSLVINYGNINNLAIPDDSVIINGIDVKLPVSLASKIPQNVSCSFNKLEIAEMIICSRLGLEDEIIHNNLGYNLMANISSEFNTQGYSISGFMGLHGKIAQRVK
ncbi:MAG TPA: hypothetical protein GXX36_01925 [Clostridiaceae bacterium]|nr:hypothetical protein [Clostridiaceae bacterium]